MQLEITDSVSLSIGTGMFGLLGPNGNVKEVVITKAK